MPHLDVQPLTDEWFRIRWEIGNVTASNVGKLIGIDEYGLRDHPDGLETGSDIIAAWESSRNPDRRKGGNIFTRWGQFYEDTAVDSFEKKTGIRVDKSNYWQHPTYEWLYATPDGLISEDTILEIKNPWKQVHEFPPPHYMAQMQTQMACSGRKHAYFMSQCIRRDNARIWKLEFSQEYYDWMIAQLLHWHEQAVDPNGKLDLSRFDRKPPHVDYEIVCDIESIVGLLGKIPVYEEVFCSAACEWGSEPIFRKNKRPLENPKESGRDLKKQQNELQATIPIWDEFVLAGSTKTKQESPGTKKRERESSSIEGEDQSREYLSVPNNWDKFVLAGSKKCKKEN